MPKKKNQLLLLLIFGTILGLAQPFGTVNVPISSGTTERWRPILRDGRSNWVDGQTLLPELGLYQLHLVTGCSTFVK